MGSKAKINIWFVVSILLLIDIYVFKGIKLLASNTNPPFKYSMYTLYWLFSFVVIGWLLYVYSNFSEIQNTRDYTLFYYAIGLLVLSLVPKLIFITFHFFDDIKELLVWVFNKIRNKKPVVTEGEIINRSVFITQIGLVLASIPFIGIVYGMLKGRFDFRVLEENLSFPNLPKSFDGLRVVQISDVHIGSFFNNYSAVQKGIDMVNKLQPDIILFTGDLVNNFADELEGWHNTLSQLEAKHGKYSIFGNHDYGDYIQWNSIAEQQQNIEQLKKYHKELGFDLLLNESRKIIIGQESFSLIGVENWGKPPFKQYGDLNKAMQNVPSQNFKLLLSHDPSHWDLKVINKTDVDLTLAGHTHGMQFGVEIAGVKWSPVKYKYPRWGGLYQEKNQYLYVNRGFGYLGFPGRVGMPPEITLLTLQSKKT